MNPCPCGYLGDPAGRCACTPDVTERYRARLSGPLLDRIDIVIEVPALPARAMAFATGLATGESASLRARVSRARDRAMARQAVPNARLDAAGVAVHCEPSAPAKRLLARAVDRLGISARGFHRIAKVARSIADLDDSPAIESPHVAEALGLRRSLTRRRVARAPFA